MRRANESHWRFIGAPEKYSYNNKTDYGPSKPALNTYH